AQLRHPDGQRRGRAVQDRRGRAVARSAAGGGLGRPLPDASHAGPAAELPHRGRARRGAVAAAAGRPWRPRRGRRGPRGARVAAPRRPPPRRARARARLAAPRPAPRPPGPPPRAPPPRARRAGRADHGLLPPGAAALCPGAGARVREPRGVHGGIPSDRALGGGGHRVRAGLRHRRARPARAERAVRRAVRGRHQGGRALRAVPGFRPRSGARGLCRAREPAARPRLDRRRRGLGVGRRPPARAPRGRRPVTIVTHVLATTLGVQALGLHGRDAALAYVFGVGVDVDHALKAPFDLRGYYWRSSLQEPVALLWIVPLSIFLGTVVPIVFFAIHVALDYSVRFEKMPFYPYARWVTRGWLTGIPDRVKEAVALVVLLALNVVLYRARAHV